jgi:arginine-tRNA-protein transferase
LGYWVPGSQKMGYKAKFSGLEIYHANQWKKMTDPAEYADEGHPLSTDPIAEQVANIQLPEQPIHRNR